MKTLQLQIECPEQEYFAYAEMVEKLMIEDWIVKDKRFTANDCHKWVLERNFVDQKEKDDMMIAFITSMIETEGISDTQRAFEIAKYMKTNKLRAYQHWMPFKIFAMIHQIAEDKETLMTCSNDDSEKTYYYYKNEKL